MLVVYKIRDRLLKAKTKVQKSVIVPVPLIGLLSSNKRTGTFRFWAIEYKFRKWKQKTNLHQEKLPMEMFAVFKKTKQLITNSRL